MAPGDDPDLLASMFCVKHGLNERQRLKLAKLIEKNLAEIMTSGKDIDAAEKKDPQFQPQQIAPLEQTEGSSSAAPVTPAMFARSSSCVANTANKCGRTRVANAGLYPATPSAVTSPGARSDFDIWQREIERDLKSRRQPRKGPTINEMSERIVARKARGSVPAYIRLHQQALAKQKQKQREKLNQSALIGSPLSNTAGPKSLNASAVCNRTSSELNYGARMYERNKQKHDEQMRLWVKLKGEEEKKELQDATFHPEINRMSKSLAKSRSRATKPEVRLIELGTVQQERLKQGQNTQILQEKLQCPFHPKINKRYLSGGLLFWIGARNWRRNATTEPP